MKTYLNNQEVKEALILTYCRVLVEHFVNGNVMTKEEKTNLKKGGTFIKNTLKSMMQRLGESTAKKYLGFDSQYYTNTRNESFNNAPFYAEWRKTVKLSDAEYRSFIFVKAMINIGISSRVSEVGLESDQRCSLLLPRCLLRISECHFDTGFFQ